MWEEKLRELQKRLHKLELWRMTRQGEVEILQYQKDLNIWLDAESTMWNQWSSNTWLVSGDRNTGFFHAEASNRFQRNTIKGICDEIGAWHKEDVMVENIVVGYFISIFQTNEQCDAIEVVEAIQPVAQVQ